MRLSTKGRYAVMAMANLARNGRADGVQRAVSLAEIAARQEISLSYLEQLFARLRKSGLVQSVRGPGGGYRLAKGAHETVVAEIVLAVDEPIRATRCIGHSSPKGCMMAGERCITHNLWEDLGDARPCGSSPRPPATPRPDSGGSRRRGPPTDCG